MWWDLAPTGVGVVQEKCSEQLVLFMGPWAFLQTSMLTTATWGSTHLTTLQFLEMEEVFGGVDSVRPCSKTVRYREKGETVGVMLSHLG